MLSAKVNGQWLSTIGANGPITVEFGEHGSESASWQMSPTLRHPSLRGGVTVEIYDGGVRIWVGTLIEPGADGQYAAKGIWHEAEDAAALDGSGNLSTIANDILVAAHARGDISWQISASISTTPFSEANGQLSLADVLGGIASESGMRWSVTPDYLVVMEADPTVPTWHVPHAVAGRGLTPAEDEFATHLIGTYLVSAGVIATETVGSSDAEAVFGRRAIPVDLIPLGFITSARAQSILTGMFLRAGARMGWGEGLGLAHGQITTPGGTAATLAQVRSGQMVRLAGTIDTSRPHRLAASTDIVVAKSRYTDGSRTITLEPYGYAPRTLGDVLDVGMVSA